MNKAHFWKQKLFGLLPKEKNIVGEKTKIISCGNSLMVQNIRKCHLDWYSARIASSAEVPTL